MRKPLRIFSAILLSALTHQVWADQGKGDALVQVLRHRLDMHGSFNESTRYSVAFTSLKDNEQDAVVYISGRAWCGSGGCTLIVLRPEGSSYQILNKKTLARLPIVVLQTKHNGWRDFTIPVSGGGATPGFSLFQFDGKGYRLVKKLRSGAEGQALPLDKQGAPLFPSHPPP
jgi:hypothetical protein